MKKSAIALFAVLAMCAATSSFAANAVRISQVYGGGGATTGTPTYNKDYIELFNNSGVAVDISGWTLHYGSATGNWSSFAGPPPNYFTFPQGTFIQPCKYILVSGGTVGTTGGPLPIAADFDAPGINMSATTGKVALITAVNANVACGSETGTIIDKVAFGPTATCAEGSPTPVLSSVQAAVRQGNGTIDTDSNSADFLVQNGPVPRNSQSGANTSCLATPAAPSSWGTVKNIYR
jgi:hypothetical protein